ncbi:hypothetical protein AVEN_169027-1 [Araneus ventricosus]|uniref:Uncharacterized protein n=1 Tax=Araneus ventricosus TaxID=182803 RepID=A0A4Y2GZ46_ARAVE|nr:hypothetical protein AVEN_169027-1 [Araneus ventricosus]
MACITTMFKRHNNTCNNEKYQLKQNSKANACPHLMNLQQRAEPGKARDMRAKLHYLTCKDLFNRFSSRQKTLRGRNVRQHHVSDFLQGGRGHCVLAADVVSRTSPGAGSMRRRDAQKQEDGEQRGKKMLLVELLLLQLGAR